MISNIRVLIVGAGRIGQAFHYMTEKQGASVELCDSEIGKCPNQRPLIESVPEMDILFLCIPSWTTRDFLTDIRAVLRPDTVVISVAKGIEKGTLKTVNQIVSESLPAGQPWGLIIGPMLAEEITLGQGSAGVLASPDARAIALVRRVIDAKDLRLEQTRDARGAALCGVLKNIFALGLGIGDGLGWGANRKGWLMTHAIREMRAIVALLGGDPETADGPAGLGDLVATGTSPYSRNRATGDQIVKTGEMNPLSEGYVSCCSLRELLGARESEFLFLSVILSVVLDKATASERYTTLLLDTRY